jgi:hypothetical protein
MCWLLDSINGSPMRNGQELVPSTGSPRRDRCLPAGSSIPRAPPAVPCITIRWRWALSLPQTASVVVRNSPTTWLTTVLTSTESFGYVNLTESMRLKRSARGAFVTEGGYEKADTRVGHWDGQRGRGMIVRGPEPGTSHPRGRTVCFVETAESMGGPSGPCQRYSLPVRQGEPSLRRTLAPAGGGWHIRGRGRLGTGHADERRTHTH